MIADLQKRLQRVKIGSLDEAAGTQHEAADMHTERLYHNTRKHMKTENRSPPSK
jgi:hypothetical protein